MAVFWYPHYRDHRVKWGKDATMTFEPIETQEQFDAAIKERIDRAKKTARQEAEKELAEKYGDYEALKERAAESKDTIAAKDKRIKELEDAAKAAEKTAQDLTAKIGGMELAQLKARIANEVGLPLDLAGRLAGDDEESIREDAENMKALIGKKAVAPLAGYEKTPVDDKRSALKGMLDSMRND